MDSPRRKPVPRLEAFDYRTARAYFLTVCTKDRTPLLAEVSGNRVALTPLGEVVEQHLKALTERHAGLTLDAHVIMPDHLHAIVWLPPGGDRTLSQIVGLFKAGCSRDAGSAFGLEQKLWQRSYFDRVIRSEEELDALRQYITENPLRWSLRAG